MTDHDPQAAAAAFRDLLRAQRVWDTELPAFDPDTAPAAPLPLFHRWFAEAVAAGQPEPHVMQLATADPAQTGAAASRPDVRTLMLHDADDRGWHFATHAGSRKGRQLAANPAAALHFYWPTQGRQIRIRGRAAAAPPAEGQADLHARSTGALAAALVGRQSEPLAAREELARASDAAWQRAVAEPSAPVPSWTLYVLEPDEVEFFQGDARRQHVRLRYERTRADDTGTGTDAGAGTGAGAAWSSRLLWP
ncbi:pyridoxine/pyridoxamine 5'-phosphate oxidase [Streptomyces sp. O3]